jgi:hypothetical protein
MRTAAYLLAVNSRTPRPRHAIFCKFACPTALHSITGGIRPRDDAPKPLSPQPLEENGPPTEIFGLFKLPLDIKTVIYREYFIAISSHGQNIHPEPPNLLAVVRCRPDLYPEVADIYRHEYKFTLWYKNKKDFHNNVSMELVRSIRYLTIGHGGMQQIPPHGNGDISQIFGLLPDSRSLRRYRDFDDFTKYAEWHNPLYTKIH